MKCKLKNKTRTIYSVIAEKIRFFFSLQMDMSYTGMDTGLFPKRNETTYFSSIRQSVILIQLKLIGI